MARKKIESTQVKLENEGDTFEGTIVSRGTATFEKGGKITEVGKYDMVDSDGVEYVMLGATDLDDKMRKVPDGTFVYITYKGTTRTLNGMNMRLFDVEIDA